MAGASPLLVTLALDEESLLFFTTLRQRYFPPERNFLPAHLMLFHHLPPDESKIREDLQKWSTEFSVLHLTVTDVKSIGKGVAYKIESKPLLSLHRLMQNEWKAWLQPQDRQGLWPHVTVQNKVTPATAKETLAVLQNDFIPFTVMATGFQLWSYEGGPWKFIEAFPFDQTR